MSRIQSKNIIVTGATSGIGEKIARKIAKEKGKAILVARSEEKLKTLTNELINKYQVQCSYYVADLVNSAQWEQVLSTIIKENENIDALINNAGMGVFDYVEDANWQDIERMVQVNVMALIQGTYHLLPHFLQNNGAHIINIGSQAGKIATPKSAVYAATKHAVIGFSNALRLEVKDKGVLVTTVNLGPVRTNFFAVADPTGNYQKSIERWMLDPDKVAQRIVDALFTNTREINMPRWMDVGSRFYQAFPSVMEQILKKQFTKK